MNKSVLIVLGGGLLIAVLVAVMVQASLRGNRVETVTEESKVEILVASADLKTGTELTDSNMRWQSWPQGAVFAGAIVRKDSEKASDVITGRLRRPVTIDEPIMRNALVEDKGNFLAASLHPGMRAVAIEVNAMRMAGGFIGPGDYVDVVLVYRARIETERGDALARQIVSENLDKLASETILQNVMVLAVDQTSSREKDEAKVARTVTLAVSREEAEKLFLATEMGTLTLALRGIGDDLVQEQSWPTVTDMRMTRIVDEVFEEFTRRQGTTDGTAGRRVRIYDGESVRRVETR